MSNQFKSLFRHWLLFASFLITPTAFAALEQTTKHSHFYCLNNVSPNNEVVILVHGWSLTKTFDSPLQETKAYYENAWKNFIAHFQQVCLHTWNVREGIPTSNNPLTQALVKLNFESQIPYKRIKIIAHSQGGNYAKDALVKLYHSKQVGDIELITMGTPHLGSDRLYLRNAAMAGEILAYTGIAAGYAAWLHSLYNQYQNAQTDSEKQKYQIMLGVFGTVGVVGAFFIGQRMSQFDEIYNYPGLLQLLPLKDNPMLMQLNQNIRQYHLNSNISAIYSDYNLIGGDEVVPLESGSWEETKLKNRQLMTGKSHLDFIEGDAEIFTYLNQIMHPASKKL